eukprot:1003907-Pyramimonas_sp.AAC.1
MDLFRLICYIKCTSHYRMSSWVGDRTGGVLLKQYSDADLASDISTQEHECQLSSNLGPIY